MNIEITNESGFDIAETELISVARFALTHLHVNPAVELSIVIFDAQAMADLHMRWMDLPGPTDVMSFPMDELEPSGRPDSPDPSPTMLGDIVLCPEFAQTQAHQAGHSLAHELALLTIHGVLHLIGFDHVEPDEEREMFALQNQLLHSWIHTQITHYHHQEQQAKDHHLVAQLQHLDHLDSI